LPTPAGRPNAVQQQFFARLGGVTTTYAYDPAGDVVDLQPAAEAPVLQWLIDSHFTATEWRIRESAHHARTKTVRRETSN
jgi:hypothetical protein